MLFLSICLKSMLCYPTPPLPLFPIWSFPSIEVIHWLLLVLLAAPLLAPGRYLLQRNKVPSTGVLLQGTNTFWCQGTDDYSAELDIKLLC